MTVNEIPAIEYADEQIRKCKVQRQESLYRNGKISLETYAEELRRITTTWTQQNESNQRHSAFSQHSKNSHTSD